MYNIRVQLCMLLLLAAASCPAFAKPVVINLKEAFGVVPDDGADDTEALRRAVEAGLASNGPVVFEFEPGMYDLCTRGVYDPFVPPALANHPCDPGWSVDRRGLIHVTGYPHALTFRTVGQGTATLNVHGFDWSRSGTRGDSRARSGSRIAGMSRSRTLRCRTWGQSPWCTACSWPSTP